MRWSTVASLRAKATLALRVPPPLGNIERPALEGAEPIRPRHQRVGRAVQRCANGRIPNAGNPAGDVRLA